MGLEAGPPPRRVDPRRAHPPTRPEGRSSPREGTATPSRDAHAGRPRRAVLHHEPWRGSTARPGVLQSRRGLVHCRGGRAFLRPPRRRPPGGRDRIRPDRGFEPSLGLLRAQREHQPEKQTQNERPQGSQSLFRPRGPGWPNLEGAGNSHRGSASGTRITSEAVISPTILSRSSFEANSTTILPLRVPIETRTRVERRSDRISSTSAIKGSTALVL